MERHRLTALSRIAITATLVILAGACSNDKSAEDLFRETLAGMEQAIEDRDVGQFMEFVSKEYQDSEGRTWKDIRRIAQLHVLRNRSLHIYRHIAQMAINDDQHANAVIFVALAGQPIESAESLANMRAELIRFEVRFELNEIWQVVSAQWKRAGINNFL